MSPIEARLYEAMVRAGLLPMPQYCIKGYFADFAFPSVLVAVEADGAFHQTAENLARDRWRDWILRRAGWTVFRFHGTTINDRADNCAFVVHREVQGRWDRIQAEAQYLEAERRAQTQYLEARRLAWKKALRHPFRTVLRYLRGSRIPSPAPAHPPPPKPP